MQDTDTGKICMMISLGSETIVEPLPDRLAGCDENEIRHYLESIVPELIERLRAMRQQKLRKFNKKVADA